MPTTIRDLQLDEANEAEMARHGVTPREVRQVLLDDPRFFQNRRGHAATRIMIGRTDGGRLLTVPIAQTALPGVWRPATAWLASEGERTRYERSH